MAALTGTISRAYTNQDGVTHVLVKAGREMFQGPLRIRGEPVDDLPGCTVSSADGGRIWSLNKGRAAA